MWWLSHHNVCLKYYSSTEGGISKFSEKIELSFEDRKEVGKGQTAQEGSLGQGPNEGHHLQFVVASVKTRGRVGRRTKRSEWFFSEGK